MGGGGGVERVICLGFGLVVYKGYPLLRICMVNQELDKKCKC